jgi:Flp pilus assembly pilin Flp
VAGPACRPAPPLHLEAEMTRLKTKLLTVCSGDRGATAAEYCLLLSLIAGVIIATVITFGQAVLGLFQSLTFP